LRQDFRIICAVGAGWPTKQLSMDAWEPLLAAVRKDCPSRELCFLTGTDSEKEELEEAWPRLEKMDICLLPNLNLKDLKEFLRPGDLFIGMDSGPTHLASSRGCLTLTFFGASLPEAYDRGGAGAHAPRGVCHLRETFERRCDRLRDCQRCSAIDSIDVVTAWRNFWTSIEPPS
jgi:ADP-heptose:LPS heptosyltransferase